MVLGEVILLQPVVQGMKTDLVVLLCHCIYMQNFIVKRLLGRMVFLGILTKAHSLSALCAVNVKGSILL